MEIIVLVGIPGSGKSTLAKNRFPNYKRLNLDALHTRSKEDQEITNCLMDGKDVIVDNTNTTKKSRNKYVQIAKLFGILVARFTLTVRLILPWREMLLEQAKSTFPIKRSDFTTRYLNRLQRMKGLTVLKN